MRARRQNGFTLVEILISIVVLALLIMVGIPSFTQFMANSRIRVAADGLLNGVQRARNEAIRRNQCMQVKIENNTGWALATCADPEVAIETRPATDGTKDINSVIAPAGGDTISFSGLGRVVNPNPGDGSQVFTQIEVDHASMAGRKLRVVIPPGGAVRMCDPAVPATDTRAC